MHLLYLVPVLSWCETSPFVQLPFDFEGRKMKSKRKGEFVECRKEVEKEERSGLQIEIAITVSLPSNIGHNHEAHGTKVEWSKN